MSNNQCSQLNFNKLIQYRDEILKAEIGALLFNLGKTHIGFWEKNGGFIYFKDSFKHTFGFEPFNSYKQYYENNKRSYFEYELKKLDLIDFILAKKVKLPFSVKIDNTRQSKEINWIEFFKGDTSDIEFIKKIFFKGCENLNSTIDKGYPTEQTKPYLWISNAFGSYKEKVNEGNFDVKRLNFYSKLREFLNKNNYIAKPNWKEIRNFVLEEIKNWYSHLLSDSRFPVNDVTLWDQAYMTASLFKATLAQLIAENINNLDNHNYFKNPSSIKWRILGIQYDKMGLAEKGFKLASIRWYRNISREIDDAIKELIEVEYPIGNEIYRDETGIYFIVGECLGDDSKGNSIVPLKQEFKELEDKILEIFKKKTNDEFYPAIYLTKASRGLMNLTTLLEKANENFLKANWEQKSLELSPHKENSGRGIGICPICKTRLIYEKDKEKNNKPTICEICDNRIHHARISSWINNLNGETIWIDEIKDKNNRVTYVSLKFELSDWLSGDLLNTLLTQQIKFQKSITSSKHEVYNQVVACIINSIKNYIENDTNPKLNKTCLSTYLNLGALSSLKLEKLLEEWLKVRLTDYEWRDFAESIIKALEEKKKKKSLSNTDLEFLSKITIQFLLRKNPSPARLRRIWESTQDFFKNLHNNLDKLLEVPEWRKKRLVWKVESPEISISKEEELECNGLKFWIRLVNDHVEVYLISSIEEFLKLYGKGNKVKENFNKEFVSLQDIKDGLVNFELKLKRTSGEYTRIVLKKENLVETHNYKPFSLITDISPVNYQVMIPAEYLPKFIDKIIEEYDKNFKYVYGKLPLHVGIITSYYKKPLYVSLKALRRIRRDNINPDKLWQRRNINEFCQLQKKKLKHATTEELMNQTEEYYSLYFDNPDKKDYQFYIKPDKNWKKWISTVSEFPLNSQIEMIPNTFDFEFMDTNTRRNDIFYDEENHYKRALPLKSNRPYELEIYWPKFKEFYEIFKDKNKSAKLHKLIELLYEKVQNYNEAFKPLLASAFVNILELRKDNETLERIRKIFDLNTDLDILKALEEKLTEENLKLFIDMFEFWHTALKEV